MNEPFVRWFPKEC